MMRKLTLEAIQAAAASLGGRCVSEAYVGSLNLMDWECADGHRWRATAHSIRQGHWCKRCADARLRTPQERVAAIAARHGGQCLGPYVNTAAKVDWACARGHRFSASLNSIKRGKWCPDCRVAARRSNASRNKHDPVTWLRQLYISD